MRLAILFFPLLASAYYTMSIYAPSSPDIHARVINARDKAFVIGASTPSTYCGLDEKSECPAGTATLIDEEMTRLAASVPGGQFIFISPDGNISYSPAHSALRPPGSQVGGFAPMHVVTECKMPATILTWMPSDPGSGLWACPVRKGVPLEKEAVLKATTGKFTGVGCISVEGVQIQEAGDGFAAWAYT